jgi:bifunctional enzyme CysN/CysC
MNIVIVGHVDHGKSTIVGRLLADTGSLPDGKLEQVKELCRKTSKPFEYAFLLDALKDEREQGITIDSARCFFRTAKRKYIVIDAPGHIEFLRNMVTGASRAEAALLVIDAAEGVMDNSRRHGYMLSLLGIKTVAVVINKMDIKNYDKNIFDSIVKEFTSFLNTIGISPLTFIPVSGMEGDNIAFKSENTPWYEGNTIIELLDSLKTAGQPSNMPFRMYVQGVYKFTAYGDDRRIIAGTVETGYLRVGDIVVFNPSGKKSRIKSVETFMKTPPETVEAGWSTGYTLEEQIYVTRGELVSKEGEGETCPQTSSRIRASIFWLGNNQFEVGKDYIIKIGSFRTTGRVLKFLRIMNSSDLSVKSAESDTILRFPGSNDVAECIIELDRPASFDTGTGYEITSRFVLIDNYEVAGGGIIREGLQTVKPARSSPNTFLSEGKVTEKHRNIILGQKGLVVWFTGLSGSGKSTLAVEVEKALVSSGRIAYRLDGDNIRHGLNSDLGFTAEEREENIRRIAEVSVLFKDAGIITLVSFISPRRVMREKARALIQDGMFLEVYVKASLNACIKRDTKGLYRKALDGSIKDFTGVSAPYEEPYEPDILLDTEKMDISECTELLVEKIMDSIKI